jgi:FdhD protein
VEIQINESGPRLAMLCLPQNLEALAVGFLRAEGLLRRREDLTSVQASLDERKVFIRGDFDQQAMDRLEHRWTWGVGCGGGGTSRDLDKPAYAAVGEGLVLGEGRLIELVSEFQTRLDLWKQTGGVHACVLADAGGLGLLAEDVGRHNAFDKVIGLALLAGVELGDKLLICTGRLSAELVSKAVACGLPFLATRGAVTALAVDLARRFGLTLVGFVRGRRLNVYSGFQRVIAGGATRAPVRDDPGDHQDQ